MEDTTEEIFDESMNDVMINPTLKDWEITRDMYDSTDRKFCQFIKMLRTHGAFEYIGNGVWRAYDRRLLYIDDPNYREGDPFRMDYLVYNINKENIIPRPRDVSSIGRAPDLQSGG